ncbi:unnamed protein product [Clonostachys chloroleuca]|uniref:Uncharacterized protein n=1 Tax=Clonostachys chloroleuca TaxID=1926264 RepID=A0AA35VAT0_9HYPO|nr:unnamed protein product [Clonostachys chloroleuca]
MVQRELPRDKSEELKNPYEAFFHHAKYRYDSGYSYSLCNEPFYDTTPKARRKRYEELWFRGIYAIFWAEKTRARFQDSHKRDIMAPMEQFQWIGAKRPDLEMNYYDMIDRPNVELVDLQKSPIQRITPKGIVTTDKNADQVHQLDVIIVATGYDSVTGSLYEMNVKGMASISLQQKWRDGIQTYLGMMVPGLSNAFMLYGPQAPSGLANEPPFLELQVEWLVDYFKKL